MTETPMCPHCGYNLVADKTINVGPAMLDQEFFFYNKRNIALPRQALELLGTIMKTPDRVVRSDVIANRLDLWETTDDPNKRISVLICKIRRQFKDRHLPNHIQTVWGGGVMWSTKGEPFKDRANLYVQRLVVVREGERW